MTYPLMLIIEYLNNTDNSQKDHQTEKIINATLELVKTGYQKIFKFFTKTGGFEQLGDEKGVEDMTAYCLSLFYKMV